MGAAFLGRLPAGARQRGRDPKIIHELNRHQHLPRLAKAYLLTGDERYSSEAVAQLNIWIDQNPPGRGINWQSSLEIGIRAISWLWTIFPLLASRRSTRLPRGASASRCSLNWSMFTGIRRSTAVPTRT